MGVLMMTLSRKITSSVILRPHGSVRWLSSRYVLGSHKFHRVEPGMFPLIVKQAIDEGVTVFDIEQGQAAQALADVLLGYNEETRLTVLARLGYNVVDNTSLSQTDDSWAFGTIPIEGPKGATQVIHSLNASSIQKFFKESPLVNLSDANLEVVPMIHNPEEHRGDTLPRLIDTFCSLEELVSDGKIPSFGVVSNGLSLPPTHPLYLDWKSVVFEAAIRAAEHSSKASSSLSVIQLPANMLETRGLVVAQEIKEFITENDETCLPRKLDIYCMRPLTCFPDQGAGSGFSFQLIDFRLPTQPGVTEWTHQMKAAPPVYEATFKRALSYFDAVELLEAKQQRELTEEEEETLLGAKMLSDMIQGLDVELEGVRSFAQHEQDLMARVVPLLNDVFDGIDDESMEVLQNFFGSLGIAARYHISRNTRKLISQGNEGVKSYDIPPHLTLQDFALKEILEEKAFSKVVVGATKPEHVRDTAEIFRRYQS